MLTFSAIDALTLDYTVKFPLSLVISRKTILRYQLLFRFLLHLKHVEQSLSAMWIEQKAAPWRRAVPSHPEFERWRSRVFLLRARMLSFVQQILAFATFEVLEPNWRELERKLEVASRDLQEREDAVHRREDELDAREAQILAKELDAPNSELSRAEDIVSTLENKYNCAM